MAKGRYRGCRCEDSETSHDPWKFSPKPNIQDCTPANKKEGGGYQSHFCECLKH